MTLDEVATMGNEVLVTGAAGFIGGRVARACVAAGWQVTTLDRRGPAPDVTGQTESLRADLADAHVLRAVRAGRFAAVLHLAGISSTFEEDWAALERTNVSGPMRLAAACAASGTRFIYASSHSIAGSFGIGLIAALYATQTRTPGPGRRPALR
jgi:ADP-L-glycero-D-manno-heptose 6-epimerase